jgi:hypothetical protein
MSRAMVALLLMLGLAGCSTRNVVVNPEEVPGLNDSQWTIKSPPGAR